MLETKDNTETKETKDNELKGESGSDYQVGSFFLWKNVSKIANFKIESDYQVGS